jgi:endonuclease YncB( thermonuclease family)
MIDTPEITQGKHDCYGEEARQYNEDLVLGQEVSLTYDQECEDPYGRLLAYVEAPRRRGQQPHGRPRLRLRPRHPAQRRGPASLNS